MFAQINLSKVSQIIHRFQSWMPPHNNRTFMILWHQKAVAMLLSSNKLQQFFFTEETNNSISALKQNLKLISQVSFHTPQIKLYYLCSLKYCNDHKF
jgi:hypothetical protein